jgi:hypothetical protein
VSTEYSTSTHFPPNHLYSYRAEYSHLKITALPNTPTFDLLPPKHKIESTPPDSE